jgi:hypothetical protein
MKINMKTLCTVGALLYAGNVLAITEVRNENGSTYRMTKQSFDKEKEGTGNVKMMGFPSIADCVTFLTSACNINLDDNTLSSIKDIVKYYDTFVTVHDLLEGICDVGLDRQQLVRARDIYQNLLEDAECKRIDESIESAAQMFDDAEIKAQREATINDAMEASAKIFDVAEIEADKATSQAIVSHSSYSKFGQFFKLMWSKFTESKLGRTLNLVRSYFFQH